ncbi:MAG: TetR/AcrR family transcriptional regulator [Clostridiaceae bacterium]|jgi:AcrR family transcriptional regulator
MDKPYHHGNLKNALLEAGIALINNEGESNFSLRKVAALCGVSHAAPYSHFQNKEDLLKEMQAYVTAQFMQTLEDTVRTSSYPDDSELLIQIGKSYVLFFLHHPQYFSFLFSQPCMALDLSMNGDVECDFPPFRLFRDVAQRVLKNMGLPATKINDAIISMWALVHGLSSIVTMKYVHYDQNWETKIEDFIRNNHG